MVDLLDVSEDLRAFHLGQDGSISAIVFLHLRLEELVHAQRGNIESASCARWVTHSDDVREHRDIVPFRFSYLHLDQTLVIFLGGGRARLLIETVRDHQIVVEPILVLIATIETLVVRREAVLVHGIGLFAAFAFHRCGGVVLLEIIRIVDRCRQGRECGQRE